ncbi:transmembrane protein 192-like isoform X1 [Xenia sp. Carnegie-2017]|uniref:transmembrane protein 192-like isoform X1 n=1 Tax=Xenia sp. Carnegie-2017 TaxID=2897299 RepID=UPI001F04796B|nr:transmembrane protein 192-like isoform X1 [Xenia sp. Carnegie-2017]
MVSLGPSRAYGQTSHSHFAFLPTSDIESVHTADDDLLTESNFLSPVVNRHHTVCLYLPWIACFEALLLVAYEVMIFVFSDVIMVTYLGGINPPLSFLTLLHVLLWVLVMIVHILLDLQHHQLKLHGYLNFCHSTQILRNIEPVVLSCGNAILLVFFCTMEHAWAESSFHHYHVPQILYSVEFLIMFPAIIFYIVKVMKFKRKYSLPDCYAAARENFVGMDVDGEIGYNDSAWPNGILEKQADMIRYLQQHNEFLSRRLLEQTQV